MTGKPLPDREARVRRRPRIPVDRLIGLPVGSCERAGIGFDAAYIAKRCLNEPGAEHVRAIAREAPGLSSCELARLELVCIVRRHLRERHIRPANAGH
jgi:hypothetical protein